MKHSISVPFKIYKTSSFLILIFLYLSLTIKAAYASFLYFADNFDDGDSDGWEVSNLSYCGDSKWKVNINSQYGIRIDYIRGCKTQSILLDPIVPADHSFTYEFDMTFSQSANMDRNFYIKYHSPDRWYGFHIVNNVIDLEKVVGQPHALFPLITYPFQSNHTYHIKTTIISNEIVLEITNYLKETFSYTYYDTEPTLPNKYVGLRASTGDIVNSEVWFDNVELTIFPHSTDNFNLPILYTNRTFPSQNEFKNAFWNRMTALFDHNKLGNKFQPFTTNLYTKKDCPTRVYGETCYDSHNGSDFSANKAFNDYNVLPVADGKIVYVSDTSESGKCMTSKNSYGCVIIIKHNFDDLYTLYAHLSEIYFKAGDTVVYTDIIGKMGNTGCSPKCGIHLHLGVLKDKTPDTSVNTMSPSDWNSILEQSQPSVSEQPDAPPKHYCTYKTPDGNILSFQDPSGWMGEKGTDMWALPTNEIGCATESPYLWMHDIGTSGSQAGLSQYFLDL